MEEFINILLIMGFLFIGGVFCGFTAQKSKEPMTGEEILLTIIGWPLFLPIIIGVNLARLIGKKL